MVSFAIPSALYPPGVIGWGPFVVATGTRIQVSLLREAWPDSGGVEIIAIDAEQSHDGGASWQPFVGFGCAGGVLPDDKFGLPQLASVLTTAVVTPCRLRGTLTTQQAVTTTITVTIT